MIFFLLPQHIVYIKCGYDDPTTKIKKKQCKTSWSVIPTKTLAPRLENNHANVGSFNHSRNDNLNEVPATLVVTKTITVIESNQSKGPLLVNDGGHGHGGYLSTNANVAN